MARLLAATFTVLLTACTSDDGVSADTGDLREDIDSDVVGMIRSLDGAGQPLGQLRLGGNTQDANDNGIAITLHIPPGSIPARGLLDGHAQSHVPVDVVTGWDSTAQFYLTPFTQYTSGVTDGAAQISEPGVFEFAFPAGALEYDGEPANEDLTTDIAVVDRAGTLAMPGTLNALSLDTVVEPIDLFHAIRIAPPEGEPWKLVDSATLSIDIAPDDPMRNAGKLYWYWYNWEQGFWHQTSEVTIAGDVATGGIALFAWWAIGTPELPDLSCAQGRIEDNTGNPIPRAEVLISAEGIFGTRRAYSDFQGDFCTPVPPGAEVSANVFGVDQALGTRFTGSASFTADPNIADCLVTCVDIGVIKTEVTSR